MDTKMKAHCWCCETCVETRRQKLNERGDSREVFPSQTVSSPNSHTENGKSGTMSGTSNCDMINASCNDNNVVLDSESTLLNDNDCVYNDELMNASGGYYDMWPFDHIYQVMNSHPQYYKSFLETHHFLMRGTGPLPYDERCYIGIMAAARHHCSYLVKSLASSFLVCGGDKKWLTGLESIPKKLRNLCEVNRILGHRPWMLMRQHIEKLTKGRDNWSISELTQALILLAHFHSLSSFVFACGITLEAKERRVHSSSGSNSDHGSLDNSSSDSDIEIDLVGILERMKLLNEDTSEMTQEESRKRFNKIESQTTKLTTKNKPMKYLDLLRFVDDPEFGFEDFAKRDPNLNIPTYVVQDYSWDDHGYSLTSRLYTEIASLLDDKFQVAQGLTYYKMGHEQNVDTSTFRRATWNYIHCLFGMFHDDYDYGEIDHLLEKNLKWYIKAATCTPESIVHRNYASFMKEFFHSEKVHINIMILEARLQAELLYSLRAISRHMT